MIRTCLLAMVLLFASAQAQARPGERRHESPAACPPQPYLVLSEDFADPRGAFAQGSRAFRRMQIRFAAAFRRACARGHLRGWRVMAARAQQGDRLFLANRPESFGAWIQLEGEEDALPARMVLEFPFLGADGAVSLPHSTQLDHAILCGVEGRYWRPDQDILACLPD